MTYEYEGWKLYRREIIRQNCNRETVYFFSKRIPPKGSIICDLPDGHTVKVMKRTGLPIVVKKEL